MTPQPPIHKVKVTREQYRKLMELQDAWRAQRMAIIFNTNPMSANEYISMAKDICPDMKAGHENVFEIVDKDSPEEEKPNA